MRILIVGLNFYPELTGIGKYTGEMAGYLAEQGHKVRVVTTPPYYPQWKISKPYKGYAYKHEQWAGVEVYRCPLWLPKKLTGFNRLLHLISFTLSSFPIISGQLKWKPDIIMNIAPSLLSAFPSLAFAKFTNTKSPR